MFTNSLSLLRRGVRPITSRLRNAIFGFPLFYKILVANCVIVTAVALGTWLAFELLRGASLQIQVGSLVPLAGLGLGFTALLNFLILKAALLPLETLERTAAAIQEGDLQARVQRSLLSDPWTDRLAETLNRMLDLLNERSDTITRYHRQVLALSGKVLAAQEEERRRLARELHDETAQALTSLQIRLRLIGRMGDPQEMRDRLEELRDLTVQTLEGVRRMALALRPAALDDLGLVAALQSHTKEIAEQWGLPVVFRADGIAQRLPSETELVLYRVVQEALSNVGKHAHASRASVRLEKRGSSVVATIEDDGVGFDLDEVLRSQERGLGLFGMQERLSLINGTFHVESSPGKGTKISVEVPVGQKAEGG